MELAGVPPAQRDNDHLEVVLPLEKLTFITSNSTFASSILPHWSWLWTAESYPECGYGRQPHRRRLGIPHLCKSTAPSLSQRFFSLTCLKRCLQQPPQGLSGATLPRSMTCSKHSMPNVFCLSLRSCSSSGNGVIQVKLHSLALEFHPPGTVLAQCPPSCNR